MRYLKGILLAIFYSNSILMANLYTHEPTGWGYDQTVEQAFYIFNEVDIFFNGIEIIGEGDGNNFENSSCVSSENCDVVGSFITHRKQRDGFGNPLDDDMTYSKCNQIGGTVPQDWFIQDENGEYTGEIEGCQLCIGITYYGTETTALALGISANDADEKLHYYATPGDSIEFKFYDASEGSILELTVDSSSVGVAQDNNLFNDENPAPLLSEYGLDRWISNMVFTYNGPGNDLVFEAMGNINGCTNPDACNYNLNANVDDGSCQYPEDNFDCNGNCVVNIDCGGMCGGDAFYDNCDQCMCGSIYGPDESECDDDDECEQGCDNEWYSDLDELPVADECGICGGDGSTCNENSNDLNTPYRFQISSIYPNPFNPSTTISYTLANIGLTNIKVLDVDGREIQILLNKIQNPGEYQLKWNPNISLSSGNYFIHVKSSDKLIIKKVTYIK